MSPAGIEVSLLNKIYKTNGKILQAVDNLSLTAQVGQVFSFLGPNGAGKTTTIKMICGLITPTSGQIRLNGYDIARQPRQALSQIGVVLEGARNIYWRLSAWENLLYFGRLRGCPTKELKERAEGLLKELELWDRRNDEARLFSRGMQQKVAIAAALVNDPPIILLDEPTLGLDVQSAKIVEGWIEKLAHHQNKTVLITTHQLDMVQDISDHVAIIKKGKLIADEPVANLLKLFHLKTYDIKVEGILEQKRLPWLKDFMLSVNEDGTTTIRNIPDQSVVYDLLDKLRDADSVLLGVTRAALDLEEVFIHLLGQEQL
jgi:ABC-2 type transport system ATP-binding protein